MSIIPEYHSGSHSLRPLPPNSIRHLISAPSIIPGFYPGVFVPCPRIQFGFLHFRLLYRLRDGLVLYVHSPGISFRPSIRGSFRPQRYNLFFTYASPRVIFFVFLLLIGSRWRSLIALRRPLSARGRFALASVASSVVPNHIRAYPLRRPARFGLNASVFRQVPPVVRLFFVY